MNDKEIWAVIFVLIIIVPAVILFMYEEWKTFQKSKKFKKWIERDEEYKKWVDKKDEETYTDTPYRGKWRKEKK